VAWAGCARGYSEGGSVLSDRHVGARPVHQFPTDGCFCDFQFFAIVNIQDRSPSVWGQGLPKASP
jgi:hypothetical protein